MQGVQSAEIQSRLQPALKGFRTVAEFGDHTSIEFFAKTHRTLAVIFPEPAMGHRTARSQHAKTREISGVTGSVEVRPDPNESRLSLRFCCVGLMLILDELL
jgi:hypothetical protein